MASAIILKTFTNRPEAELARGLLEQYGIGSWIQADDLGHMYPHLGMMSGVKLIVDESDAQRAHDILEAEPESPESDESGG